MNDFTKVTLFEGALSFDGNESHRPYSAECSSFMLSEGLNFINLYGLHAIVAFILPQGSIVDSTLLSCTMSLYK